MIFGGIPRRSSSEIAALRRAGRVVAEMHDKTREAIVPGVSTALIDAIAAEVIERRGATSNFLGYHGYPAVTCISPNEVIVHGIPGPRILEEGDIVSVDCGAVVEGWHGDAAYTVGVGEISVEAARLIELAEQALDSAIAEMMPGNHLGDIGWAVQQVIEGGGFHVVEGYTGHGIGQAMHEEPSVPNIGRPGKGQTLKVGNVLAIEPMVASGTAETSTLDDDWTVVTLDGSWAAHTEHTVVVTDDGPEILTLL